MPGMLSDRPASSSVLAASAWPTPVATQRPPGDSADLLPSSLFLAELGGSITSGGGDRGRGGDDLVGRGTEEVSLADDGAGGGRHR